MIDVLAEPFSQGIGQRALVEVLILAAVCGPLGVWVVLYRQSYAAESIAHGMLPGLVVAALAGLPLGLGAAAGLLVAAALVSLAGRQSRVGPDVAVGVTITALFGAGALLALAPDVPARLGELLFGDPLGITSADLAGSAALALAVLASLYALHRSLAAVGFDTQSAPSLGARPGRTELALLVLLAATTLVAVQALGNLLVVALIIAPSAAALRLASRLPAALALAVALAAAGGIGGLYLSHYLKLAAGASIALVAIAIFAVSVPLGGARIGRRRGPGSPVEAIGP
ncbi:MAG TPA: metal ABC transporter permease [Solirubrobacterales bacterium]|nr:metal ABC transporter permease [Solirubrobacterales bacterium]